MRALTTILMAMAACAIGVGCIRPAADLRDAAWLTAGGGMLAQGEPALI